MCCLLLAAAFSAVGCGTVVPAGKTVVILHPDGTSTVQDKGAYFAYGRDRVFYIDEKMKSFTESMSIICADEIPLTVDVKALISIESAGDNKEFLVKKIPVTDSGPLGTPELSLDQFYEMAVADIVRSSGRQIIESESTENVRPNREAKEKEMTELVRKRCKELNYPIHVAAVLLSDIQYPESVRSTREAIKNAQLEDEKKAAIAEADLAQAQREVAVEQERAKVRLVKAQAQADENKVLAESLTPEFLAWHQMESLELVAQTLSEGPNNTTFMFPFTLQNEMMQPAMFENAVQRGLKSPIKAEVE